MDTVFVIMLKDKKTGFLEKELGSLSLTENEEYIVNMYVSEENKLFIRLSVGREVSDWEYSAIYDYYDTQVLEELGAEFHETEEDYDPVWLISIEFSQDINIVEDKVKKILSAHHREIQDVFETIKDKECEYTDEE